MAPPVLNQDLSFPQRREDLPVQQLGIMEQAHHLGVRP
jgi:hypothetical protein